MRTHKHKCPCGAVWEHEDPDWSNPALTDKLYDQAHDCPRCGCNIRRKYFGLQEAWVGHNLKYPPPRPAGSTKRKSGGIVVGELPPDAEEFLALLDELIFSLERKENGNDEKRDSR